jgi:hypothetical protein
VRLVLAAVDVARDGRVSRDHVDRALEATRDAVDPQLRLPTLAEAAWVLFAAGDKAEADVLLDEIVAALGRDEAYGSPAPGSSLRLSSGARAATSLCLWHSPPEGRPAGERPPTGSLGVRWWWRPISSSRWVHARSRRAFAAALPSCCRCPTRPRAGGSSTGPPRSGAVSGRRRPCGRSTSSAWRSVPRPRNEPAFVAPLR